MSTITPEKALLAREQILESQNPDHARAVLRVVSELCWDSLANFVVMFWPELEPGTKLEWAWYHDLICKELELVSQRFEERKRSRLVIAIPPGCMKSLLVSVFWPARWWLINPTVRFLALSSTDTLASRDSRRMRDVLGSPLYQMMVEELSSYSVPKVRDAATKWELSADQRSVINFANSARGVRACFAIGGSLTGHRGDGLIIDDPHQVKDVLGSPEQVAAALEKVHDKVDVALPSRVNDQRRMFEVVIQQRVAEDDVAGRRLRDDDPDLRKVVLAMHYDPASPYNHPDDPRTEVGELLDEVRFPEHIVSKLISKLDMQVPGQGQAQYEQTPVPASGNMFKRDWMNQRYSWDPQRPPIRYEEVAVTIDCTFKRSKKADYVSMQAWGRIGWTKFYLLDELHERMSYVELREAAKDFLRKHLPNFCLIEEKANGAALIDDLKMTWPCVLPFIPDKHGDKVSRAQLCTPYWAAGNIWLPENDYARWIGDYVAELVGFPKAMNDDRVDAMSQLFLHWGDQVRTGGTGAVNEALRQLMGPMGGQY